MMLATLTQARSDADFSRAHELFVEYSKQLGVDLCFQGFATELKTLDTMYAAPFGALFLATLGNADVGCVGVRRFSDRDCEMKRLYLRQPARGTGVGRQLAQRAIDAARELGYRRMLLDTLHQMAAARGLYATLGFTPIAPYYDNPMVGVSFLALEL